MLTLFLLFRNYSPIFLVLKTIRAAFKRKDCFSSMDSLLKYFYPETAGNFGSSICVLHLSLGLDFFLMSLLLRMKSKMVLVSL